MTRTRQTRLTTGLAVQDAMTRISSAFSRESLLRRMLGTAGTDLGPADVALLRAISLRGPVRLSELAVWQGLDKSTLTPRVRRLEQAGLLQRAPDPADGRAALVSLTPRGTELLATFTINGTALFDQMLSSWAAADRHRLAELLQRLADEVEDAAHPQRKNG